MKVYYLYLAFLLHLLLALPQSSAFFRLLVYFHFLVFDQGILHVFYLHKASFQILVFLLLLFLLHNLHLELFLFLFVLLQQNLAQFQAYYIYFLEHILEHILGHFLFYLHIYYYLFQIFLMKL